MLLLSAGAVQRRRVLEHPTTALSTMTAIRTTRAAGIEAGDAPTRVQTHFDARDTIAGDLDDTTVRQAAGGSL